MNEIILKLEAPELTAVLRELVETVKASFVPPADTPVPAAAPVNPTQTPAPAVAAPSSSPAPGVDAPASAAPAVPVASAPAYTLDQISRAGAFLVDAGKMDHLLALLGRYGVQAVTQLQPEQYGAFATELRALGAQI